MMGTITNTAANTEYNATISGLANSTAYDVYVVAEDSPTMGALNLQASPTKLDVSTTAPSTADILEDFAVCSNGANIGAWAQVSVVGAQTWGCTTSGKTGNGARMNGFSGGAQENEDWLISPALDLSAFSAPNFSFWVKTNFQGPALTLKVSTNYTTGAPNTATWSNITVTMPAAGSNTWTEIKDLDLTAYKSANTRLAFVYNSVATTNGAAEWIVDDLKAYNKAPQIILTKAQTLDVVTWNLEWFGDNTQGPADDVLQRNNIKTVIQQIDADIYCLQEVTNQNGLNNFQTLVDELAPLGYSGVRVTHTSGFGDAQQARAFIYKTATFSNVSTQVLALAGSWADGRQPVIFKGDATIEGTTKTFRFITLHAKAGATVTDFTARQDNATTLKNYIDANFLTDNVIVLGDFNDDLDNSIAAGNPSPYKNFVDDVAGFSTPTKTELSDKNLTTFIGATDPIDHIVLSNEVATMYYGNSAKREDYTTSIADYANTTTDHYPVSIRLQIGTVTPDVTSPTFTNAYPQVSNITTTSFELSSAISEAGKSYFVVLPNNATAPTSAQVKAGLDATGAPVSANFKGSFTHTAANLAYATTITGIAVLTDYEVFVVAEDVIPNLQAAPTKVHVTAIAADIVPPTFTTNFPKTDQIKSNAFRLVSNVSEPSKVFFVVLPNNADAPTSAQVKAGQNATGTAVATASFKGNIDNPTANADAMATITGASPNTDYDVFVVAEDLFGNIQTSPTKLDVKTAQILFTSGYPKASNITKSSVTLLSNLQEVGTTYFVVLSDGAPAPTAQQVAEAKDASGSLVAANLKGGISNATALTEFASNVVGLDANTDYDVYLVAKNATNDLQPAPVKLDIKTADVTANEDDLSRYVRVFPNPSREKVQVSLSHNPVLRQASARLLSVLGKTAGEATILPTNEGTIYTFEVKTLPAGIYIIELSEGNRKFFRRIIVK
jgi:endonuclease/exonuclease/phosphatase family metal-dependent hydrolase